MILDEITKSITAVLASAIATTNPVFAVSFQNLADYGVVQLPASSNVGDFNGVTPIELIPAPVANRQKSILHMVICNVDTVSHIVTVFYKSGATSRQLVKVSVAAGQTLEWTIHAGWVLQSDPSYDLALPSLTVGDVGTEGIGININGTNFQSTFKVSDIDGANYAQTILHRHSTIAEPLIVGARTNSDTAAHASVVLGQNCLTIYGVGWAGANYKVFGAISFGVDSTGTVSDTSAPGRVRIQVTPDGSLVPADAITITNDKKVTLAGVLNLISGSASAPGLFFSGNANTGIYSPSANKIAITNNGAQTFVTETEKVTIKGNTSITFDMIDSDGGANRTVYRQIADGGFAYRFMTDDLSSYKDVMLFDRGVGTTISSIILGNATDLPPIIVYGAIQNFSNVLITASRHFQLRSYTVATLPSAATAGQMIYVSDGTTNKRLAVSDGTNWRWPDGAIVS